MAVAAVVQARMGSSRLPGKVLADLAGRPVLAWVIDRLRRAEQLDQIVVATSTQPGDDEVVRLAEDLGTPFFRGSEGDVLARYHGAASAFGLEAIVRVTADCPLLDPRLVDDVVVAWREQPGTLDFVANTLIRRYPRGLDVALCAADALERAHREARLPRERAHVTPYLRDERNGFRHRSVEGPLDLGHLRWTLDEPDDLRFIRAVYDRLVPFPDYDWLRVYELVRAEPWLADINHSIRQKVPDDC